jgi:hypothetical protein
MIDRVIRIGKHRARSTYSESTATICNVGIVAHLLGIRYRDIFVISSGSYPDEITESCCELGSHAVLYALKTCQGGR